jgi:chitinase
MIRTGIARLGAFAVIVALATAAHADTTDTVYASSFEKAWVSGYYVGYQRDLYPIDQVDFDVVTHLVVGRVTPNEDGSVDTHFDIDPVTGPAWAREVAQATHAAGAKAVLMVGGAGEHANWVGAASPANLDTFVDNLLAAMDDLGYDGLDLDWEPIETGDEPRFIALAQALRTRRPDMLLTVPLGWINANFANPVNTFAGEIAPLFDQVNLMTYDMAGGWPAWRSWHSSALAGHGGNTPTSVQVSVDYHLAAGVPRAKLGIGIPFYGTCWRGVAGPGQDGGFVQASDNAMSYRNIVDDYFAEDRRQWDAGAFVPYLGSNVPFGPQQCTFVSYDDEESIAAKGAFVRQNGLGGTIVWTISQGHLPERPPGERDPLLRAIGEAFR